MKQPRQFVALFHPQRPGFMKAKGGDISERDAALLLAHFDYLNELLAREVLVLAGPCLDGAFGIVVLQVSSAEDARSILDENPAVKDGFFKYELHPYRVTLMGS